MLRQKMSKLHKSSRAIPPIPAKVWRNPWYFIAFGLGSGAMPFAPGTFGTLMAIPFYLLLRQLPLLYYISFVLIFIIFASILSDKISKDTSTHDHPGMCIDEFAGFFVTMVNAPVGWQWILLGFIFFRFFDIVKPWPINIIDKKMQSGFGMILDDVLAGIYAFTIIQIINSLFF
jgi:phosphatidylglycerophosphatase A